MAVQHRERGEDARPLRVLDAMSGTGVRALRYVGESGGDTFVHANDLQFGDHPLAANLAPLVERGVCVVSNEDAVTLYHRARAEDERSRRAQALTLTMSVSRCRTQDSRVGP